MISKNIVKTNSIKKDVKDWEEKNNLLPLNSSLNIEKPENFEHFKYTILNEKMEIRIPIFKDSEMHFYSKKFSDSKKRFLKNNTLDKDELTYFLLLNYKGIKINNIDYDEKYFIYFLKEILNDEFKLT
ncbi:hypothetical protein [Metamycoplasma gateae]|uniref:Uncharacterized protein n=1 Tax=Metamycoplasma gateae TaxID=35769 RepID=A0ABZ2AG27_9BACT|nr:hypothetical protein V2E26_01660 [Metamycoplasma gateae]